MSRGVVETPTKTFLSGAALAQHRRVQLSSGVLQYCDAYTAGLGTLFEDVFASAVPVAVRLDNAPGTRRMIANAAITAGNPVYAAASGKVAPTGFVKVGLALEAAAADGDSIEVLPTSNIPDGAGTVAAAGSAQGDAAALTSTVNYVSAADGTKGVLLPAAKAGLRVQVYNLHASNGLKVYPASGDDINDGTQDAAITTEGKTLASLVALDDTTWAAQFTANT